MTLAKGFKEDYFSYMERLNNCFTEDRCAEVYKLAEMLDEAWNSGNSVYICGNGGSAANALHIANDLHYGITCGSDKRRGIRVEALSGNVGIVTCLANDTGYENVYANQIEVKAERNDVLIALSGSGNSPNIVRALDAGNRLSMKTVAILGFSGGECRGKAKLCLHFPVNDMQISEDIQLIVGHMCMQWLRKGNKSGL